MRKLRHSDAAHPTDVPRSARESLMLTTPTAYHTDMSWIHQKGHELKESSKEIDHGSFCRKGIPKVWKLLTEPMRSTSAMSVFYAMTFLSHIRGIHRRRKASAIEALPGPGGNPCVRL